MGNRNNVLQITLINNEPEKYDIEGFVKNNKYTLIYSTSNGTSVGEFLAHVNKYRLLSINSIHKITGNKLENDFKLHENASYYVKII